MSIDDLAYEAEVEASVLRLISHLTPEKAERFLIALAFKIKQVSPRVEPVVLRFGFGSHPPLDPTPEPIRYPDPAVVEAIELAAGETRGRKDLTQKIIDFLTRCGGTSTVSNTKDACLSSKWTRVQVGAEINNMIKRGVIARGGSEHGWLTLAGTAVEAPAT